MTSNSLLSSKIFNNLGVNKLSLLENNYNTLNLELQKLKNVQQMNDFAINYGLAIDVGLQYFDKNLPSGYQSRLLDLNIYPNPDIDTINLIGNGLVDLDNFDCEIRTSIYDKSMGKTSLVTSPIQNQFLHIFKGTYKNSDPFLLNQKLILGDLGLDLAENAVSRFSIWYGAVWWFLNKSAIENPVSVSSFLGDFIYKDKHYDGVAYAKVPSNHMNSFIGSTSNNIAGGNSYISYNAVTMYFKNIDGNMALSYMVQNAYWAEDHSYEANKF